MGVKEKLNRLVCLLLALISFAARADTESCKTLLGHLALERQAMSAEDLLAFADAPPMSNPADFATFPTEGAQHSFRRAFASMLTPEAWAPLRDEAVRLARLREGSDAARARANEATAPIVFPSLARQYKHEMGYWGGPGWYEENGKLYVVMGPFTNKYQVIDLDTGASSFVPEDSVPYGRRPGPPMRKDPYEKPKTYGFSRLPLGKHLDSAEIDGAAEFALLTMDDSYGTTKDKRNVYVLNKASGEYQHLVTLPATAEGWVAGFRYGKDDYVVWTETNGVVALANMADPSHPMKQKILDHKGEPRFPILIRREHQIGILTRLGFDTDYAFIQLVGAPR